MRLAKRLVANRATATATTATVETATAAAALAARNVAASVFAVCALLITTQALAQSYRDVAPLGIPDARPPVTEAVPPEAPDGSAAVAVPLLRGLNFVAAAQANANASTNANASASASGAVNATGLPPLDASFLTTFDSYIGKPLTFAQLAQIRRAVVARYRAAGQPLVDVYVPEQDVESGIVQISVAEFRLGKIEVHGNRYFSTPLLTREMPLTAGSTIDASDVDAGLGVLNANPYRRVNVIYAPGTALNTTDVILQTDDRLPLRIYGGYDNDGVRQLGRDRFMAGFGYGNLFGLDQQISYQATASNDLFGGNPSIEGRPNRPRFVAHSVNYVAPLPWQDRIEIFGVFAQSTPRLADSFGQTGISTQLSFRYDLRLPSLAAWQQQVQFGYDFKRSNNDLEFGGAQVFNANTHIHQWLVAFDATRADALGSTHANVTLVGSPGRLDSDNNDAAFDAARLGAKPRYGYLQLSAQRDTALGAGFVLTSHGLFQWSPDTLLPSEEIGLGGEGSVRGYDTYSVQGDRGWNVQTEVRAPGFAFGASGAAVQPFVFFDAGHVWNRIDEPAETQSGLLASVGAGLRFQFGRFVDFRMTYGAPLKAVVANGSKAPMVLLMLVVGS